jgi:TusA-related sulfurtransferase
MDELRLPETILEDIAAIRTMERGKLCEIRTASGCVYHNLQFWCNGANRTEYVANRELETVREATANFQRFRGLTDEYAAAVERRTRQERKGADSRQERGGSAKRRQKRPRQR